MKTAAEYGLVFDRAQAVVQTALEFATKAHEGQVRKYTGEPYINHPIEVAQLVYSVYPHLDMVCAALLHDTMEDCNVTVEDLTAVGLMWPTTDLVKQLTDVSKPEDGNRATRKLLDLFHTARACPNAMTIKLADLISNSRSIIDHDPGFAKVYMNEKRQLLKVLHYGNPILLAYAQDMVDNYFHFHPQE